MRPWRDRRVEYGIYPYFNMSLINKLFILVVAVSMTARAHAQLKWEQTALEVKTSYTDEAAVGHFKYENTGPKPVHIASVKTSCGCTVASLKSNDVAPGEKGEITATLKLGDRVGLQHKTVSVTTDDNPQPTILSFNVAIPQLLEVQPMMMFWTMKDPLNEKVITVKAPGESPVTNITATSTTQDFTAEVKPGDGPKEWKVNITPKNVTQSVSGSVTIQPQYAAKTPKVFHVAVHVQRSPSS